MSVRKLILNSLHFNNVIYIFISFSHPIKSFQYKLHFHCYYKMFSHTFCIRMDSIPSVCCWCPSYLVKSLLMLSLLPMCSYRMKFNYNNNKKVCMFDHYPFPLSFCTLNTRTDPSAQHDAKRVPSAFQAMLVTGAECSFSSLNCEPAAKSKIRIFDSSPPEASSLPSGLKLTHCTGRWLSVKTRNSFPDVTHQRRTVRSVEPVAI